ncbi:hypothetical protein [Actinokineospora globicatena]|uniref:Uncharacterized protein n=1 Tax=Actinokineospora globicatena TaxID=103729 RepID=A0A9W6QH27_9PSEU|nr:hypothetical protein [Actinokineospora globicatena]GLW90901.1 hypothetical protein Aglo03_17170 [Actinokineospora globicatena]
MLVLVLVLVLGAFGLLVAALTTANTVWAWISVVISVVAAAILLVDWLGSRRRRAPLDTPAPGPIGAPDIERIDPPPPADPPAADVVVGVLADPGALDPDQEPAEESTDAADLLVVSELRVDVRVLDERPRYHLSSCGWLGSRSSIELPVAEARQLGFTPCAHCTPDAALAAEYRAARGPHETEPPAG